jgi:hypothetical protein
MKSEKQVRDEIRKCNSYVRSFKKVGRNLALLELKEWIRALEWVLE